MKTSKLLLLAALTTITSATSIAGVIAYEPFDYTSGTVLQNAVAPPQFTGWKANNTTTGGYDIVSGLTSGSLATAGNGLSGGYQYTVSGMNMNFSNTAWDPYKMVVADQYSVPHNVVGAAGTTMDVTPAVPEPATFALLLGGFGTLTLLRRRR